MSTATSRMPDGEITPPTSVRHLVLTVATLMSVLLYLDRFAVNIAAEYICEDLRMTQTQMAWLISAFFWSYSLCQVPTGWMSDRFGARIMLTGYILTWSVFTGLMGWANAVWMMLWLRLLCGIAQAGAYPTAVGQIRQWYPISSRGMANSIVGLGGRFGAVLAPVMTAWLIVFFASSRPVPTLEMGDVLNVETFTAHFDRQPTSPSNHAERRQQFVESFMERLSPDQQAMIHAGSRTAQPARVQQAVAAPPSVDIRDWLPLPPRQNSVDPSLSKALEELVVVLNAAMHEPDFIDFSSQPFPLSARGQSLLDRRNLDQRMTDEETVLLNRLGLESLFPGEIRKSQGVGWRPTMIVYGIAGILVAGMFAVVTRTGPQHHPWCNDAERKLIREGNIECVAAHSSKVPFPFRTIVTNLSLWGNCLTQFLCNFGWLFIVLSFPRYLDKVHGVPLVQRGYMTAIPIALGIIGYYMGGHWTDWATHHFGLKWGRRTPLVASRFASASGYGVCLLLRVFVAPSPGNAWLPWLVVVGLSIVTISTDSGVPALWAFVQDVGGRYTASILGWCNMWGNMGSAVAPLIYNFCLGENPTIGNWNLVFAVCGGAFALSGFSAMLIDATKPLTVEQSSP